MNLGKWSCRTKVFIAGCVLESVARVAMWDLLRVAALGMDGFKGVVGWGSIGYYILKPYAFFY